MENKKKKMIDAKTKALNVYLQRAKWERLIGDNSGVAFEAGWVAALKHAKKEYKQTIEALEYTIGDLGAEIKYLRGEKE